MAARGRGNIARMPAYAWTCLACGQSNAAAAESCGQCACSATPTSREINTARQRFTDRGGALQGDALMAARPDLTGGDVASILFHLFIGLFGISLNRRRGSNDATAGEHARRGIA